MRTPTSTPHKILLIGLCLMAGAISLNAQSKDLKPIKRIKGQHFSNNSLYIGILGSNIPASLNYEHIWTKNGMLNIGTRFGGFYAQFKNMDMFTIANGSFEVNFILGSSKHQLDMGIGWTGHYGSFYSEEENRTKHYGIPTKNFSIGYRYQKPGGGLFFKAGLTTSSIMFFATNDLSELAIGNAAIFGFELLTGEKPSFRLLSVGIGYSFR